MPIESLCLRRRVRRSAVLVFPLLVVVLGTSACEVVEGQIHAEADLRVNAVRTKQAGMDTVARLRPTAQLAGTGPGATPEEAAQEETSSCPDDFGFDKGDVTRSEPRYRWTLHYATRADYLAALAHLRAGWKAEGLPVTEVPAWDRPGRLGLPGISTKDHGIQLSLQQSLQGEEPTVSAIGECMRHHEQGRAQIGTEPGRSCRPARSRTPAPRLAGWVNAFNTAPPSRALSRGH
ncbi:hypothetical protein [Streptomyces sp. NPDC059991]|uniref:hypothetical protein n=1 Tax=unclassified Streptomyces TaxID=2593676 RepID=UPI003683D288